MEIFKSFIAHDSYVLDLQFTHDSRHLISAGMDSHINMWEVESWQRVRQFSDHNKSVNSISLSPNSTRLVSGSTDHTTRIWDVENGRLLNTLQDRKQVVSGVAFSPNEKWVAQVSYSGRLMIWTVSGEPIFGIKVQKKNLGSLRFSPDSKKIAVSGLGGDVSVYSVPDGELLTTLSNHQIAVGSLQFMRNGRYLLSAGYEYTVKLWDTVSWAEARSILMPIGTRTVALNANETAVVFLKEGELQIWSLPRWSEREVIPISTKSLSGVAFSPDGKWLAIGAADKRIRIWKLK